MLYREPTLLVFHILNVGWQLTDNSCQLFHSGNICNCWFCSSSRYFIRRFLAILFYPTDSETQLVRIVYSFVQITSDVFNRPFQHTSKTALKIAFDSDRLTFSFLKSISSSRHPHEDTFPSSCWMAPQNLASTISVWSTSPYTIPISIQNMIDCNRSTKSYNYCSVCFTFVGNSDCL